MVIGKTYVTGVCYIMFLLNLIDFTQILFMAAEISNPCQNLTQTASSVGRSSLLCHQCSYCRQEIEIGTCPGFSVLEN